MAPHKFVIKCGNFAVLVDLYVLPLGGQEDASWFTTDHIEDVAALVQDSVDQRVKQYTEFLHNRRHLKQKELASASAFVVEGENFDLVASFLKRHSNLRCLVKQDLRVFPERYVVCVSRPKDASAHHGNPSLAVLAAASSGPFPSVQRLLTSSGPRPKTRLPTELSEQSRSAYFSSVGETQELLNSSTKTKKTVLQKLAKQASVQRDPCGSAAGGQQHTDREASPETQSPILKAGESETSAETTSSSVMDPDHKVPSSSDITDAVAPVGSTYSTQAASRTPNGINLNEASADLCQHQISQKTSKRSEADDAGEDPHPRRAKRTCLGRPPATTRTLPSDSSTQTSKRDLPPPTPLPPAVAKIESKAFPVSERKKTTVEVELLTPGKRAQRLPLTSNNTAQTNQNRLAASLRGLSVKPASSGSSIGSRSTLAEEASENVPRTSRLRRLKKS